MKNAEEWSHQLVGNGSYRGIIKQIQLDAMKEGARRAAEIEPICILDEGYDHRRIYDMAVEDTHDAITVKSSQWTEKDL